MNEEMENVQTGGSVEPGKTFTQEQVNAIVGERLAKEKSKGEAELVQREKEIAKRELAMAAKEKLVAQGLPVELLEAINAGTPEELEQSLRIMAKYMKTESNQLQLNGARPGNLGTGADATGDSAVRQAMGLR